LSPEDIAIIASGTFLLCGLITGVWKYKGVRESPDHRAHPYVDIAHRASLLYAFASLVLAEFAARSPLSDTLTFICISAPLLFFAIAVSAYIVHGLKRDTENQFEDPGWLSLWTMNALIIAEIGGFGVLFVAVVWHMLVT